MPSSVTGTPAGTPSTMIVSPGPCDSPAGLYSQIRAAIALAPATQLCGHHNEVVSAPPNTGGGAAQHPTGRRSGGLPPGSRGHAPWHTSRCGLLYCGGSAGNGFDATRPAAAAPDVRWNGGASQGQRKERL